MEYGNTVLPTPRKEGRSPVLTHLQACQSLAVCWFWRMDPIFDKTGYKYSGTKLAVSLHSRGRSLRWVFVSLYVARDRKTATQPVLADLGQTASQIEGRRVQ